MEAGILIRVILGLLFVLALIGGGAVLARRLGFIPQTAGGAGRGRRLAVIELAAIDTKHRLALVRRDDVAHLLLIGPNGDLVVETRIRPALAAEPGQDSRR